MTLEQRTTIAPQDISGIEYGCQHCQAKYSVPLDRFDRILHQCPNCHEELISEAHLGDRKPSDYEALSMLVKQLVDLQNRHMPIRFELLASCLASGGKG